MFKLHSCRIIDNGFNTVCVLCMCIFELYINNLDVKTLLQLGNPRKDDWWGNRSFMELPSCAINPVSFPDFGQNSLESSYWRSNKTLSKPHIDQRDKPSAKPSSYFRQIVWVYNSLERVRRVTFSRSWMTLAALCSGIGSGSHWILGDWGLEAAEEAQVGVLQRYFLLTKWFWPYDICRRGFPTHPSMKHPTPLPWTYPQCHSPPKRHRTQERFANAQEKSIKQRAQIRYTVGCLTLAPTVCLDRPGREF